MNIPEGWRPVLRGFVRAGDQVLCSGCDESDEKEHWTGDEFDVVGKPVGLFFGVIRKETKK
jgi:hypothetical protein